MELPDTDISFLLHQEDIDANINDVLFARLCEQTNTTIPYSIKDDYDQVKTNLVILNDIDNFFKEMLFRLKVTGLTELSIGYIRILHDNQPAIVTRSLSLPRPKPALHTTPVIFPDCDTFERVRPVPYEIGFRVDGVVGTQPRATQQLNVCDGTNLFSNW